MVAHLVAPAEVRVLVGERVEAVRAAGDDPADAGLVERRDVLLRGGLEDVLVAHPPRRIAGAALARPEDREVDAGGRQQPRRRCRCAPGALVERRRAADPVEHLGRRLARREDRHAELAGPVGPLRLRAPPRVRRPFDVAQHRLRLGGEARLDHHEVPAQVDDVVDVLDRDRAGLDAGAACHAVPDHLVAHRAGDERGRRDGGARPPRLQQRRALLEQLVAQPHDQELRRELLPGRERRTGVLAATALSAGVGVEHLLPGQVGGRAGAEAQLVLGRVVVEAQRLEPPARAGAAEPDVDRGGRDVQVLGVGQVGEESEHPEHMGPDEHALGIARGAVVAEQVRERLRDRRPRRRVLVQVQRDPRGVPQQQRGHDPRDPGQYQICLAQVAALEAPRPQHVPDVEGRHDAAQHERREDVDEQRVPALVAEPRQRPAVVDDADHRDQDRRQQHAEAPEDDCVHEPGAQPREQLALAEHDRRLVARAPAGVAAPLDRRRCSQQPREE